VGNFLKTARRGQRIALFFLLCLFCAVLLLLRWIFRLSLPQIVARNQLISHGLCLSFTDS
jgi:hypothetical protein